MSQTVPLRQSYCPAAASCCPKIAYPWHKQCNTKGMTKFTTHLKNEGNLIRTGLDLLKGFSDNLLQSKPVSIQDVRIAVYAMQIAFEKVYLVKKESVLFPALISSSNWSTLPQELQDYIHHFRHQNEKGRTVLLKVRACIDDHEQKTCPAGVVGLLLAEFVDHLSHYLHEAEATLLNLAESILNPNEQSALYHHAREIEFAQGLDQLRGPRLIFSQLQKKVGHLPI